MTELWLLVEVEVPYFVEESMTPVLIGPTRDYLQQWLQINVSNIIHWYGDNVIVTKVKYDGGLNTKVNYYYRAIKVEMGVPIVY